MLDQPSTGYPLSPSIPLSLSRGERDATSRHSLRGASRFRRDILVVDARAATPLDQEIEGLAAALLGLGILEQPVEMVVGEDQGIELVGELPHVEIVDQVPLFDRDASRGGEGLQPVAL